MFQRDDKELIGLLLWAWNNSHKWPTEPYVLDVDMGATTGLICFSMAIHNPKEFYMGLGEQIVMPEKRTDDTLKPILQALKLLVEGEK